MKSITQFITEMLTLNKMADKSIEFVEYSKLNYTGDINDAIEYFNLCLIDFCNDNNAAKEFLNKLNTEYSTKEFFSKICWDLWMSEYDKKDYEQYKEFVIKNISKFLK
jgi:hypothetical protein